VTSSADASGPRVAIGLPRGARDLLPAACAIRQRLVAQVLDVFATWGYRPVAPPALEYYDVVARGLPVADRRRCVRFVDADTGEVVTLRADATPQIARMIGARVGGELAADVVHRLCYALEVVRQPATVREPAEVHQVGVELIGDGHPAADAELVALAHAALSAVGLSDVRVDLAHARLVEVALESVGVAGDDADEVRRAIAAKDRAAAAARLAAAGVDAERTRVLAGLCDAFGEADALPAAIAELTPLGAGVVACAERIAATLRQLACLAPAGPGPRPTVDLGEVRGSDYYSGVRIRGWARGTERPVLRGGRYDALMRHFGPPMPASGFAIDLDALQAALEARGRSPAEPQRAPAHVVAAEVADDETVRGRAAREAQRARGQGARAWVEAGISLARAQQLAQQAGAGRLSFVDAGGRVGTYRADADGWRREEPT
jgi:ATP phosphoribosyltransferase regulatory subunit